ncbi:MAG TPA: ABC transporter substrate-binding protein [Candidatus Methylomirabilis sp.]|nr:ABC transporter substrate-binding protein [Candidatus Methylomirabilis sp.]
MGSAGLTRRGFLRGAAGASAAAAVPAVLRGQVPEVKVGAVHPVSGLLARVGQACRSGAQMAADEVNAAGGLRSLGGARLTLLTGDSETKAEVAQVEAERLIREGAVILTGAFDSGHTMAMAKVAEERRIPFLIDIAAADHITRQGYRHVFRNFPTSGVFGLKAIQFMTDLFAETGVSPRRAVLMHVSDLFGQTQAKSLLNAHQTLKPPFAIVETIAYPVTTQDLSTEVAKAKAAKPDLLLPITRPRDAVLLIQELFKQRVEVHAVIGPGSPGLYEPEFVQQLGKLAEFTMDNVPWHNPRNPRTAAVTAAFEKRYGKTFDTNSGYAYEAILIVADALERARSTKPEPLLEALQTTNITDHIMVGGPIRFTPQGDNPNASTALVQILGGRARVVKPAPFAEAPVTFPVPRLWERG